MSDPDVLGFVLFFGGLLLTTIAVAIHERRKK